MGSEIIIVPVMFLSIFGIFYLFLNTRNKERLALIEKGADANIFFSNNTSGIPMWKIVIINLACLMIGIGTGILLASIADNMFKIDKGPIYSSFIFICAGLGLLAGFKISKKLE
ncbi:MAG: hypothetical protein CMP76_07365 [Flavobacterium sp.]|uniref:DUF6249 domain-containing protein n=1 Tax=unclassified Flavobacterium TaxID=196869 RepID=UPI000C69D62F|nr:MULTISPECIES: DUF6249 domain-containing protein [unclassified Flavobacterium]MBF03099.1 hypothetical protein [Flavobacterium sp.]MCO6162255.1 hypothetical protein [Flavobacterium sp. NRK F7]|tara:strand:- start:1178 stop:1519 length:342 start_codon:yes stop_codon:yes gene_type:complete